MPIVATLHRNVNNTDGHAQLDQAQRSVGPRRAAVLAAAAGTPFMVASVLVVALMHEHLNVQSDLAKAALV